MAAGSEQRFVQQLKRGVLEMLVLQLLADRPGHGYELIVRLRESGGLLDVKEGTLYPLLYRLEEEGCITSVWNSPDGPDAPARLRLLHHRGRADGAGPRARRLAAVRGYGGTVSERGRPRQSSRRCRCFVINRTVPGFFPGTPQGGNFYENEDRFHDAGCTAAGQAVHERHRAAAEHRP